MINRTNNRLEQSLVKKVTDNERAIRELKSAVQSVGGDALAVQSTSLLFGGPLALAAGDAGTFVVTVFPASSTLTLWNFLFTVLVDGTTVNDAFPNGSNMTTAKRNMRLFNWIDWADSNDTTNVRVVKIRIENYDSSSHNYYIDFKAYYPKLSGTGAS